MSMKVNDRQKKFLLDDEAESDMQFLSPLKTKSDLDLFGQQSPQQMPLPEEEMHNSDN